MPVVDFPINGMVVASPASICPPVAGYGSFLMARRANCIPGITRSVPRVMNRGFSTGYAWNCSQPCHEPITPKTG